MSNIEKIVEAINVPKRIVDGAELFLRKLLGPAITESGQLIGDEIRFRRFKNQVIIFTKAKEFLESKSIEPKTINLKLLAPLIEYSSLEEDEKIQTLWANIIANISSAETEHLFNLKCIEILKEITPNEVFFLDYIFEIFKTEEKETLEKWKTKDKYKDRTSVSHDNSIFSPWKMKEALNMSQEQIHLYIDRLVSFGVIKFEDPDLDESSTDVEIPVLDKFSGRNKSIEIRSYELIPSERVHFTNFGLYFVKLCKFNS